MQAAKGKGIFISRKNLPMTDRKQVHQPFTNELNGRLSSVRHC